MAINNIRTSGGIFTHHFIESLQQDTLAHPAVQPEAFTLPRHDRVTHKELEKAIANAWTSLIERWDMVEREYGSLDISALRQRWLRPLFYHLNIETEYQRGDIKLDGDLRFPISHTGRACTTEFTVPVHSVLYEREDTLESRVGSGRGIKKLAPHDMVQRYLNLSKEHDWAIVTDGVYLRLLRDFHHTYTRGFVEFDLQGIFSSRDFAGFRAMYRLLHASRFVIPDDKDNAPIDVLYEDSLAMGVKVGNDLRKNVQAAIESLANGFLSSSPGFLDQIRGQEDGAGQFYRDVLMTIYRMLFLLFAEQRGMLPGRGSLYMEEYSLTSFRTLAEQPIGDDRNVDLWEKFITTISMVEHGVDELDIFAYNGALFSLDRTRLLTPKDVTNSPQCRNDHFLVTIRHLTTVEKDKVLQRISYADLSVEEIGSIYESLLEFTPRISDTKIEVEGREITANTFFLDPRGSGRKTTGSYYTPPSLVNELIKSVLMPVMKDRIRAVVPGYDLEYIEALTPEERQAAEEALLAINVVDPAAGSGAFMIAANNKLGLELARIRTVDLFPAEVEIRKARRDVLAHCIYAVDLNPMAVELCKVSLWINAAVEDAPLNFLDHHIKCGNSLVGATPVLIAEGIPNDAYKPVTGDDKDIAKAIKAQNREELKGQLSLMKVSVLETKEDVKKWAEIDRLAEVDPNQAEVEYMAYWGSQEYWKKRLPYDFWTASFFAPLNEGAPVPTTQDVKQANLSPDGVSQEIKELALSLLEQYRFFHWHIEFPHIFDEEGKGGFDVVLGNPPWEKMQVEEQQFFEKENAEIALATGKKRKEAIDALSKTNPSLWKLWSGYRDFINKQKAFIRFSNKYPYSGVGKFNTYSIFTELACGIVNSIGKIGLVVQSGLISDKNTQKLFNSIMEHHRLDVFYDFVNSCGLFPDVHRNMHFGLVVLGGTGMYYQRSKFALNCKSVDDIEIGFEEEYKNTVNITYEDIKMINPNTSTFPNYNSVADYNLLKKLHSSVPILHHKEQVTKNTWDIDIHRMFNMSDDSNLFLTEEDLSLKKADNIGLGFFSKDDIIFRRLFEAKMIQQFNHRFAGVIVNEENLFRKGQSLYTTSEQQKLPDYINLPRYWVEDEKLEKWVGNRNWYLTYRALTDSKTNARTGIFCVLPRVGTGHTLNMMYPNEDHPVSIICGFLANLNSILLDYILKQKLSGVHFGVFIINQLPIIPATIYTDSLLNFIVPIILELTYSSWDIKAFADDLWQEVTSELREQLLLQWNENVENTNGGHKNAKPPDSLPKVFYKGITSVQFPSPPYKWDEHRRLNLRCKIDALYGHLYGVTHDEFAYILEAFPIVKRREEEQYGEYYTKRVVLEEFDRIANDPMLKEICVPLLERVSVLEHPNKEQPAPLKRPNSATSESVISSLKLAEKAQTKPEKQAKISDTLENQSNMFDDETDFSA